MRSKKCKALLAMLLVFALLTTMLPLQASAKPGSAATGTIVIGGLTVENHVNPIGIDIAKPNLAWMLTSDGTNQAQTAYRILVSSTTEKLAADDGDLWDTGKTMSDKPFCNLYMGTPLISRQRVYWKVMVWDANDTASNWSQSAYWEAGLLTESDWQGKWIGRSGFDPGNPVITNHFVSATARYVRLKVTEVGPRTAVESQGRLQFMEWEIYSSTAPATNIALGTAASATNALAQTGSWAARNLTDGSTADGSGGYSSGFLPGTDISANPIYVTIDLGSAQTFDQFKITARTAAASNSGNICPCYPKQYVIETSDDGNNWTPLTSVNNLMAPTRPTAAGDKTALPLFAKDFAIEKLDEVASARLYISGLGHYEAHVNGQNVSDAILDPGETDYNDTILYVTYDVTGLLKSGNNAIGIMLGNGIYNVGSTPGRYQKHDVSMGPVKTIAQLEVTMKDGSVQTIATDTSWKETDGPITFSGWYGGEDYDATKEIPNWDIGGTDRSTWGDASLAPASNAKLKARGQNPIRVQEELIPVSVTKTSTGTYLVDMGRNFAGYAELRLTGMTAAQKGIKIEMWPGENKTAGNLIDQGSAGGPRWDSYIIKGTGDESFHPRFVYHGFRYIEVKNFPGVPTVDHFRGYIAHTDNEKNGSFEASSDTLNQINTLVTRAVESNMYSTLTDCPHREKLGWLEVSHLMYYSMAYGFDIQSWMKKITLDMTESQLQNGMVPDIAPEYVVFDGGFRDDPTWGGAAILDPWYTYQVYGDDSLLEVAYPMMSKYIAYLQTKATNNLLNHGLGDWGAYEGTPLGLVVSATYYDLVDAMDVIATKLGKTEDAAKYAALAADIKEAFNKTYYNAATGVYGNGTQASYACALFADIVPENLIDGCVDKLVANIESKGWHLTTGEVGLRQMMVVLGKYGRSDAVYKMVTNPTNPSYIYFLDHDATTLPEFWDMSGSHNHCMMGHVQEWFYRYLAGIDHSSPGFKNIVIKPYVPEDLSSAKATTVTPYGKIASEWHYDIASNSLVMKVEIPVGATADVYVPSLGFTNTKVSQNGTQTNGTLEDGYIVLRGIGSGSYEFQRLPAEMISISASVNKDTIQIGALAEYAKIDDDAVLSVRGLTEDGDTPALAASSVVLTARPEGIVSIDPVTGKITGLTDGTATITAVKDHLTSLVTVTVTTTRVTALEIKPSKPALNFVGDEVRLTVLGTINTGAVLDFTGYPGISYTNSHSSITSIRATGSMVMTQRGPVGENIAVSASLTQDTGAVSSQPVNILNGEAVNLARAAGTTVRASSYHDGFFGKYSMESAVDGIKSGKGWTNNGGWSDDTPGNMDDWYQLDFNGKKTISAIDLYFLQDNFSSANVANPTLDTTFTRYGMAGYDVQYWDGTGWITVPGGSVVNNNKVWTQYGFDPITTNRVRVRFYKEIAAGSSAQARLVEIEVWEAVNPADAFIPIRIDGQMYTDIASATLIGGTYSVAVDNAKFSAAVADTANYFEISINADIKFDRAVFELDRSIAAQFQGKEIDFIINGISLESYSYLEELYNPDIDNSTRSSPAVVSVMAGKTPNGDNVVSAISQAVSDRQSELFFGPVSVNTLCTNFDSTLDVGAYSEVLFAMPEGYDFQANSPVSLLTVPPDGSISTTPYHYDGETLKLTTAASAAYALIRTVKGLAKYPQLSDEDGIPIEDVFTNQNFVVSFDTSDDVTNIKLVNENGLTIGKKAVTILDNGDGTTTWTITVNLATAGDDRTISILAAGDDKVYGDSIGSVTLDILSVDPEIISAAPAVSSAAKNEAFTITVVTTKTVDKVKLANETGSSIGIISKDFVIDGNNKIWTLTAKIGTAGNRTINVYAAGKDGVYLETPISFGIEITKS